jgi:hypothetical protein
MMKGHDMSKQDVLIGDDDTAAKEERTRHTIYGLLP